MIADEAPEIVYEDGMTALPVDFRACRGRGCGNGPESGAVWASDTGQLATAFVHVVDCRGADGGAPSGAANAPGSAPATSTSSIWLYYEDSTSLRALPGEVGSHEDDWEGYQVRISSGGTDARATSHHGYNYDGGLGSWASDVGLVHRSAWGPSTGRLYVSGGSHAGHVHEDGRPSLARWTPADRLTLVPIETLDPAARRTRFAVVPPWRKPVYRDPEDRGTEHRERSEVERGQVSQTKPRGVDQGVARSSAQRRMGPSADRPYAGTPPRVKTRLGRA